MKRHGDTAKEWGTLRARAPAPSAINCEPKINSRSVQGDRTGAGSWQEGGTADGVTAVVGEAQWGSVPIVNGAAVLVRRLGQVQVPAEPRADVSAHNFWKRGTTAMFDI